MKIEKNMARCRTCNDIIESFSLRKFETCNCGRVAIAGGTEKLIRNTNSWSDLEELSEYLPIYNTPN